MLALRYVYVLALVVWLGGMVVLGAVVAPATFQVLQASGRPPAARWPARCSATILARFHYVAYAAGALLLVTLAAMALLGPRPRGLAVRTALVGGDAGRGALLRRRRPAASADAIQREVGGLPSRLPAGDARRVRFDELHSSRRGLMMVNIVGALALLFWEARSTAVTHTHHAHPGRRHRPRSHGRRRQDPRGGRPAGRVGAAPGRRARARASRRARCRRSCSTRSGATRSRSRGRSPRRSAAASPASTSACARRSTCSPTCGRCGTFPSVPSRYEGVDLVIVRENTEDLYAGLEHEVVPGVVESLKIITEEASTRIATVRLRVRARSTGASA